MGSSKSDEIASKKYFINQEKAILVNKLGLTTKDDIERAGASFVERNIANGLSEKAKDLSIQGLKAMHKELFFDIYMWAGKFRDYTTGRGLSFCRPEFIEKSLENIYTKINNQIAKGMKKEDFIKYSAEFIGELNTIHPFVDGNGRTQRLTLSLLAEKAGYRIDFRNINQDSWYNAAKEAHYLATYSRFENIIKDNLY